MRLVVGKVQVSAPTFGVRLKVPARLRCLGIGLLWAFPMLVREEVLRLVVLAEWSVSVLVWESELVLELVWEAELVLELEQEQSRVLEQEQFRVPVQERCQVLEGRVLVQRQSWAR